MYGEKNKRVIYLGIDALKECLDMLYDRGYQIIHICTAPDDAYDRTVDIQKFATDHRIPLSLERVTVEQMRDWEAQEADMLIVAGYPWKISVSEKIRQLNIHPAYLPIGRGSWPMPVAIQRGTDSGVTLHKLSEQFDAGDILLQEKIKIEQEDHLVTLLEKIKKVSVKLLSEYLSSPDEIWDHARAQGEGEYWEEPGDLERTFSLEDTVEKISTTLRAFYGYGSLCNLQGLPVEIVRGSVVNDNRDVDGKLCIPVKGRYLICEEWRIPFRKIELRDKERMEAIRRKYQPMLSDYTFSLLYCWQKELKLSLYIEEEFFVILGEDYYFFPIGEPNRVKEFIEGMLNVGIYPEFRFCDEKMLTFLASRFEGKYEYQKSDADSDYVLLNQTIQELQGSRFAKRRNAIAHYRHLQPAPEVEMISKENVEHLKRISEIFSGKDRIAERVAIEHFFELDLMGILVKRGEEYVGFSLCSKKDEGTMQGHFMKCIDNERGSRFYVMKSCIDTIGARYRYTNMEDDMGEEGLREFKTSFEPEIIAAYTVQFQKKEEKV